MENTAQKCNSFDNRPIFIIGSGRSGNTLLRRVVMSSSEVYIPPETYFLPKVISAWRKVRFFPWSHQVNCFFGCLLTSQDAQSFPDVNWFAEYEQATRAPKGERTLAALIERSYRAMAEASGLNSRVRWGDKTPMNTLNLPGISRLYPRAQFIWILRDPVDVASSYIKMGRYPEVAEATARWVEANESCLRLAQDGRANLKVVRYEQLVTEPERITADLFDFLGLSRDAISGDYSVVGDLGDVSAHDHHARVLEPIDTKSIGAGYKSLSDADLRTIASLTAEISGKLRRLV